MDTALQVQLLDSEVLLPDLTIGQAMDIAKIPANFNEKRLSAMITHLSDDPTLAGKLTAQERYFILLSHQALAQNHHSDTNNIDAYLLPTVQSEVPKQHQIGAMYVNHLLGAHVVVLEGICEDVFDWIVGQMACQLSGDISSIIGGDSDDLNWDVLTSDMSDNELNEVIQERTKIIQNLGANGNFNSLYDAYSLGLDTLTHFLVLGCENKGLTVINQGGDGNNEPSRFLTLDHLQGGAGLLAQCIA
jgi:hypothetical protein